MIVDGAHHRTVRLRDGVVELINQPLLPHRFEIITMRDHHETARAISTMIVRGAGAIGATGAAGMAQAVLEAPTAGFEDYISAAAETLRQTRPTAQNLFWGIDTVLAAVRGATGHHEAREAAVAAAHAAADDDAACCEAIGQHGLQLMRDGMRVSTHCNAGWLAFVDWGSALSPIYAAKRAGIAVSVHVDETRPRSQGARLTAWELGQEGIPHHVASDNAVGSLMRAGEIDLVIVGADRIAANGDVANKIGTYMVAVLAHRHDIPFYVAAPTPTIDGACPSGANIPIEERSADEVAFTWGWGDDGVFRRVRTSPVRSAFRNPAFDVTPAELVAGIITERGIVSASPEGISAVTRARPS